jgi:hypothetical protein
VTVPRARPARAFRPHPFGRIAIGSSTNSLSVRFKDLPLRSSENPTAGVDEHLRTPTRSANDGTRSWGPTCPSMFRCSTTRPDHQPPSPAGARRHPSTRRLTMSLPENPEASSGATWSQLHRLNLSSAQPNALVPSFGRLANLSSCLRRVPITQRKTAALMLRQFGLGATSGFPRLERTAVRPCSGQNPITLYP